MPQTSSVCSRASAWNGQLARVIPPSSARGSKPCCSRTRRRRPDLGVADRRAPPPRPARGPARRPAGSSAARGGSPDASASAIARGQQTPGQVVVPLGQGHRDVALGPPVELRRAAGAGSGATGAALEADVEQALVDQPVQVEGGGRARHGGRRGRLVPADRRRAGARRGRRAAAGSARPARRPRPPARAVVVHGGSLEPIRVDERVSARAHPTRRTPSRIYAVVVIAGRRGHGHRDRSAHRRR